MRYALLLPILISSYCALVSGQSNTINQTDAKGQKQGYWEKWSADSVLLYKGYFKDNKPVGEMRRYYETGELKAIMKYSENSGYVKTSLYYDTGEIAGCGLYYNNLKDSVWTYYSYYTGSVTSTEMYNKGLKHGREKKFYANGNLSEEIDWNNNVKHGAWNQYFEDGTLKLQSFHTNGKVNGPYAFYWPNGQVYIKGVFLNNKREGKWFFYTDEGKLKFELVYVNGKAENEEAIMKQDQEFFKMVEENIGKFEEPDINDVLPGSNVTY